jgi:hypothetical protein
MDKGSDGVSAAAAAGAAYPQPAATAAARAGTVVLCYSFHFFVADGIWMYHV